MANQPEVSNWEAGIYQFETTDPVEGGLGGIDNEPLLQLANRTLWLKNQIENTIFRTGDLKEVDCSAGYIAANFDGTGLGTNERLGWAICNGNNGTKNRNGRVSIAYGSNYPTIGATGGSKDAVVVSHKHDSILFADGKKSVNDIGTGGFTGGAHEASFATGDGNINETGTTGVSGTDKNMQPYIVTLIIQKL